MQKRKSSDFLKGIKKSFKIMLLRKLKLQEDYEPEEEEKEEPEKEEPEKEEPEKEEEEEW